SAGWEAEITLAVEALFPTWLVLDCLHAFGAESPHTRIELVETVTVSGSTALMEALTKGQMDIAVTPHITAGYSVEPVMPVRIIPCVHPGHQVHHLGRDITQRDLRRHRQLVVRDTVNRRDKESPVLSAEQRWTVSNMSTSIGAACRGYGFAWLPAEKIRNELADGLLKPLSLRGGAERNIQMYLVFPDPDAAGPGVLRLAEIIREQVANACNAYASKG